MPGRGSTPTATTPAPRISTRTGAGETCRTTAMCGFRASLRIGLLIATATGLMSPPTAGPGLATSLGDGRLTTTAAGCITAIRGPGGPGRCTAAGSTVRSGRRHMYRSMAGAAVLVLDLATAVGEVSAGFQSGLAIISIRGGADIAGA